MIVKEEPDISRYLKMREGEMEIGEQRLSYRLTEPVYFALTGENAKLEELIRDGMPVQGVSPQICRELTQPMYMHLQIDCLSVEMQYRHLLVNGDPAYYTTMEAAIMGQREDTVRFLLEHGMKLDLRQNKLRHIICQCEGLEILEMIREIPETHWEEFYDPQFRPPELPEDFELPYE